MLAWGCGNCLSGCGTALCSEHDMRSQMLKCYNLFSIEAWEPWVWVAVLLGVTHMTHGVIVFYCQKGFLSFDQKSGLSSNVLELFALQK